MSPQQNQSTSFVGQRVWLAVALLTLTAILSLTNLASAQQDLTASTLATPALSAQAGENGVDLSWTAVQGATRYDLWAWTSAGGWQEIGGDSLTATTFTHTSAVEGITYHYAVRAVNADGETSAWSDYASATLSSTSAPALTAQATGNGIELSWSAVTGAVRYELWEWDSVNDWQQIGGDNLTGTSYTRTGGTAGTTYYYAVRAVDAEGEKSGWSQYVRATALQEQQDPQHTATSSATPSSTTTATPTATHTLEPSSLRQPGDPKHTATPTATPTSTPTATHTTQPPSPRQPEDPPFTATPTSTSTSTPTATATATSTATATPPAVPLLAAAASQSSVSLSWSSVTGAARYELWVWDSVNEWQQIGGDSLTDTTFMHKNVTAGTTYSYAVRSVGASGVASAWSSYATVTIPSQGDPPTATPTPEPQQSQQQQLEPTATPTLTPTATATPTPTSTGSPTPTPTSTATPRYSTRPDTPDPPTVVVLGAGHVSVDWDDVPRATYYDLWYWAYPYWTSVKDQGARRGISFSFNGSSAVLTNMPTNFPSYYFRVLAENSVGLRISTSGSAENPEEYRLLPTPTPTITPTITPTPEGWPSAPNKPTARLIGVGSVAIDWDPVPEEASYDVYLYHYIVFGFLRRWVRLPYNGVDVDIDGYVREDIRISMNGTSATITNLPYKSQYSFSVRAHNDVGSSFSPSVTVDNPPTSTPTPTSTATSTPTSTPTSTATPTPTPTTEG